MFIFFFLRCQIYCSSPILLLFYHLNFESFIKVNERLRNRIEILTKNLHEAELKITEVVNVKKLIENNSDEEICRVPEIFNSTCHD